MKAIKKGAKTVIAEKRKGHPDPMFTLPDLKRYLKTIERQPVAIRRSVMRALSRMDVPKSMHGLAFDKAFTLHADLSETIAVKAFAITLMGNIAMEEGALKNEVIIAVEDQLPYGSPAYRNRALKILKALRK